MIDTVARRTWQIDARHLHFGGRHWQGSLDAIVASASAGLGLTFKAVQVQRTHIESSIGHNRCDLDCVTQRRGSPHSLVCTKNQASYEERVRQRAQDQENMGRLAAASQGAR